MTYYPKTKTITTVNNKGKSYKWKGNQKQRRFIENWINPDSKTFGNAYQSALEAGFKRSYALNITATAPQWLKENIERLELDTDHIKGGISKIAIDAPDSRSPDDTRLKAYEILAKIAGLIDNKGVTTNVIVQPILGGESVNQKRVIDNTTTDTNTDVAQ